MELWFSDHGLKNFDPMRSVFWGPKSLTANDDVSHLLPANSHGCTSTPYCMDLPDGARLVSSQGPEKSPWDLLMFSNLRSFSSPSWDFPSPADLLEQLRQGKKDGGSYSWFFFCSNLQETVRWKNVPLIMTLYCFLKASFWTFKSPQISGPLFFFPLFHFSSI